MNSMNMQFETPPVLSKDEKDKKTLCFDSTRVQSNKRRKRKQEPEVMSPPILPPFEFKPME